MSHPIPRAEFDEIFGKVPRLTVEIIIKTNKGVILTKRSIPPSLGKWHIPGGTVRFGEPATEAVARIAKDELGVTVKPVKMLGYIEYPQQNSGGYNGWPVGLAFEAEITDGEARGSEQGEEVGYFMSVPPNTLEEQADFLKQHIFNQLLP